MKKFLAIIFTALIAVSGFSAEIYANAAPAITVEARSGILMEPITGKVLFEMSADEQLAPASVTKVMTILLIYDAHVNGKFQWEDIVTVSEHAASMGGSQIYLEPFEKQTVRDLTKSIIIASANDASVAMAEFISGSEEAFVDLMNKKAVELGAANTNFKNACGLDADGHYTSARDLALFTREILTKYPQALEFAQVWQDSIIHKTRRGEEEFGLTNTNKLIRRYSGATGFKTGSTGKALYCLAGTAERNGMALIAVILGAPDPNVRFNEVMKLFDYGYANYRAAQGLTPGTVVAEAVVQKGSRETAAAAVKTKVAVIVPNSSTAEITNEISVNEAVTAPVNIGDKIGEITYYVGGEEAGRSDLVAVEEIGKASFMDMAKRLGKLWFQ